jgi:putative ABC transport system permease protein
MDFQPILAALRRHRTAATLIVLEIAFTCAIVSNAVFLIGERLSRMERPSGLAEAELVRIMLTGIGKGANSEAATQEDLQALARIPGVRKVAATSLLPFGMNSSSRDFKLAADQLHKSLNAANYFGSKDLLETLGVELIEGRDLEPEEYVYEDELREMTGTQPILITRAMSERLWPGQSGVGRTFYSGRGDRAFRVVGILERLVRPNEGYGASSFEFSVMMPVRQRYKPVHHYVLRVDPERRAEVLATAVTVLQRIRPGRIIAEKQTFEELKAQYYRADRAMTWLLVAVCVALLIITALGIVGLASFWVQQRTRQIGIRRALGATRSQILRYFQSENLLLATFGIALGMALAYGINQLLMERYELGRLPPQYLPIGALSLWVLGQLAVLGPALRAAAVPPAVATRSV